MLAPWPEHRGLENAEADAEIGWLIKFISEVRSVRSEMNVPAGAKVPLVISGASDETRARVARHEETLLRLARLEKIEFGASPHGAVQIVLDEAVLALPLAGIIDIDAEFETLEARDRQGRLRDQAARRQARQREIRLARAQSTWWRSSASGRARRKPSPPSSSRR